MKLDYQDLLPDENPITSVAEYLVARQRYDELSVRLRALQLEMKKYRDEGEEPPRELFDEFDRLGQQENQAMYGFLRRKPLVLVSRCPYCMRAILVKVGVFSLLDRFWYHVYSDGREEVSEDSLCKHLFCLDGALNLSGHQPAEAIAPITVSNNTIWMAAEVPFVKPRVLNLPTVVAVIHSFPVADKYTAYPIVYFAEKQPSQEEFCIGWARQEYVDHLEGDKPIIFVGRRTDAQDYELGKWVEQGKLLWLDPTDDEHPLVRGPVGAFPYGNLPGRRNPYTIKDGKVRNLRNPTTDGRPKVRLER